MTRFTACLGPEDTIRNFSLNMTYIDFMSVVHKSTKRDYLARVNDPDYPKAKAANLAKTWGYDYWDGDRSIYYGGYQYIVNRWEKVARAMAKHYNLPKNPKILDIGCGKGYLLFDFLKVIPDAEIFGIDISNYAIENSKEEIREHLQVGNATELPWPDNHFDLVCSMNTFHNLYNYELEKALKEFERVVYVVCEMGIAKFDLKERVWELIFRSSIYHAKTVYSLTVNQKHIFLGTENGLVRINKKTGFTRDYSFPFIGQVNAMNLDGKTLWQKI